MGTKKANLSRQFCAGRKLLMVVLERMRRNYTEFQAADTHPFSFIDNNYCYLKKQPEGNLCGAMARRLTRL